MTNPVIENMHTRHSVRQFDSARPIAPEDLKTIADAGIWAPSGKNRQMCSVIVITDKGLLKELSELNCKIGGWNSGFDPFYGAPAVMIAISRKDVPTAVYDGSVMLENIMLAANSLGIGSCWIHRAKEEFETPFGQRILKKAGLDGEWVGIGHVALGYAKAPAPQERPRLPGRIVML